MAYKTGGSWSEAFWSNERFDELLLQAKSKLDDTLRAEMYREMCEIARDQGGTVLPMFTNYVYAHSDKIGHAERVGATWEMDGARAYQRWWFKA